MKARMTMVAVFLAAVMIAAAVIPAATGDTGNTETTEKYIIGTSVKAVEVAGGVNAQIEFNRTAFSSSATVELFIAVKSTTPSWSTALNFTDNTAQFTVSQDENYESKKITVNVDNSSLDSGIYNINITGDGKVDAKIILFKVSIKDEWNSQCTPEQSYIWAANVMCSQYIDPTDKNSYDIIIDGFPSDSTFQYEKSYSMKLSVKKNDDDTTSNDDTSPFEFFATGLPNGLSVTSDKTIGGKLATDVEQSRGTFTVYAVLGGVAYSKSIAYTIGDGASTFEYTTDKTEGESKDPEYVIIKTGQTITITAIMDKTWEDNITYIDAIIKGNKSENSTKTLTVDDINNKKATITLTDSDFGLGSCRIDMTYHYQITYTDLDDSGKTKTITVKKTETKSMQIFVVGDIHHADLDPAVTTTP